MARVDEVRRRASDYLAIESHKHGYRMRRKRCIRHRRKNTSSTKQHRDFAESITYHQHLKLILIMLVMLCGFSSSSFILHGFQVLAHRHLHPPARASLRQQHSGDNGL